MMFEGSYLPFNVDEGQGGSSFMFDAIAVCLRCLCTSRATTEAAMQASGGGIMSTCGTFGLNEPSLICANSNGEVGEIMDS